MAGPGKLGSPLAFKLGTPGFTYILSASNSFALSSTGDGGRNPHWTYPIHPTGTLGTVASPLGILTLGYGAITPPPAAIHDVSAGNSFVLSSTATVFSTGGHNSFVVSAANSFVLSSSASEVRIGVPRIFSVSAANTLLLSSSAFLANRIILVSASNSIALSASAADFDLPPPVIHSLSAATRFVLVSSGAVYVSPIRVSASNSIALSAIPRANGPLYVSAGNTFAIGATSTLPVGGYHYSVSASNTLAFSASASQARWAVFRVNASNSIALAASASLTRLAILRVSAANSFAIGGSSSETRSIRATAANSLTMASVAVAGRDIHCTASTSLGLSASMQNNKFPRDTATNTFVITVSAGASKTGIVASNSFALSSTAWATVQFPWRRAALTRPPGGNLPHS